MNNLLRLQVVKTIQVPVWDEQAKQKIIAFWQDRGVTFDEIQNDRLKGRRGSIWGNWTSYDMSKLLADLTVIRVGPNDISCHLDVNTVGQDITDWNKAYWQLEMDTLESYLLHGDQKAAEWHQFCKDSKTAAWQWSLSGRLLGRKIPRKP